MFGETGQVAKELSRCCPSDTQAVFLGRKQADLSTPDQCARIVRGSNVDAVIIAAAWTAVDKAETEEEAALIINGVAPGAIAEACSNLNIPVVYVSTDYVFDGSGDLPFPADHPTSPINAYGRTKLAGEAAIRECGTRHLIIRTSWVVSSYGTNFVKTMLRLGADRKILNVVADQIGAPTPASEIANALFLTANAVVSGHPGGTYHFAGRPDASWADVARTIMNLAQLDCRIEDIPTSSYPTPARRPLNSRLDCSTLTRDFGIKRPDWRNGIADILGDLGALN